MRNIKVLAAFLMGAALGSLATIEGVKKYYEEEKNSYVESVSKAFRESKSIPDDISPISEDEIKYCKEDEETLATAWSDHEEISEYASKITETNYYDYSGTGTLNESISETEEVPNYKLPYVITPDEFAMEEDYDNMTLYYRGDDGVLVDEDDNLITDLEATIGKDSLNHFGEYEDNAVYVRNERIKCDYEIILDS